MLPLMPSAGHFCYGRYLVAYLLDMQNLPPDAKRDLVAGVHVCRHNDGGESVSTDQFGEQTYMRQGKSVGA